MSLCVTANNNSYTFDDLDQGQNTIDLQLTFPCVCKFETYGKDPSDTVIDACNKIVEDKYIILDDIQIDGYSVDKNFLLQHLTFYTEDNQKLDTNFWAFNGICLIDLSPTPFQWLAQTKN